MDIFEFRERGNSGLDPDLEELATRVIGAAIEVHRHLGAGLPENSYRDSLCHELSLRKIPFRREVYVPIHYKGIFVGEGFIDILVDERLVLELKVVEALHPVHLAQALSYIKILKLKLALVINFNVEILKQGIKRVINS